MFLKKRKSNNRDAKKHVSQGTCVQEYKKESNKYVRRSLQIAVITMITIVFLGWDLSPIMDEKLMKGIPTVILLWKSAEPIQSCQKKNMLGTDKKNKTTTHKHSLPAVIGAAFCRGFFTVTKQKASVADWRVRLGGVMHFHVMNPSEQ